MRYPGLSSLFWILCAFHPACRFATPNSRSHGTNTNAVPVTVRSPASSDSGLLHIETETVDFSKCPAPKPAPGNVGEDDLVRCSLSSGLVAEQNGSACFDVNRLLDAHGEPLFESQPIEKEGLVFVVETRFELLRCQGRPIAVLQGGEYFTNETSVDSSCHGRKALRHAYLVHDVLNNARHEDLQLSKAKVLVQRIAKAAGCE